LVSCWGVALKVSPETRRQFDLHGSFAWQVCSRSRDGLKRCSEHVMLLEFYRDLR